MLIASLARRRKDYLELDKMGTSSELAYTVLRNTIKHDQYQYDDHAIGSTICPAGS